VPEKESNAMGWLQRIFGQEKYTGKPPQFAGGGGGATAQVPAELAGLYGEYDESGLAKRVALAFDNEPELKDIDTVDVAQKGGMVVLTGRVANQQILDRLETVARGVNGTITMDTSQVTIG
jgi:osmotically-inducible protein OsmY